MKKNDVTGWQIHRNALILAFFGVEETDRKWAV